MRIYKQPVEGFENKFVITEAESYFVPCIGTDDAPRMIEILGKIFDLDNPKSTKRLMTSCSKGG